MVPTRKGLYGLYAITDSRWCPPDRLDLLAELIRAAISGGAAIIQLREKSLSDQDLEPAARLLKEICQQHGRLFIINDRVELAAKIKAHGVHIGKDDIDFHQARKLIRDGIVGVSCYNSLELAKRFQDLGADYVAFGSIFPSPTKPDAVRADLQLLSEARSVLNIPICAIGGITEENIHRVAAAGADMAAVISGLWDCHEITARARSLADAMKNRRK